MFAQTKNLSLLGFALLLACIFSLAYASQSGAATLTTVTSNADSGTGTLREAVVTADSNGEPDTITFDLLEGQRTITLTSGQISFTEAQETTVDGGGVVTVSGNDSSRVFDVGADASLTVRGLTVRDGSAPVGGDDFERSGGGIRNSGTLTIVGSNLTGNSADRDGGGIFDRGGVLSVVGTTVSDNTAPEDYGGGIYMSNGTMTIDRSTVSGNSSAFGGGILSNTDLEGERTTITNSTISGNTASDDEEGGSGIFNVDGLTVIEHSTITGNTAPDGVGSGVASFSDDFTRTEVLSTIISGNDNTDVDFVYDPTVNSFVSDGYNVIGDGNATGAFDQPGDVTGVSDPGLGPLADNGGPTFTHALLPGSPAVDRVAAGECPPPTEDQRGRDRPKDGDGDARALCDSGSFELERDYGSVRFASATYTVNEGAGTATITVTRTGGTDGEVSVDYATSDGTATARQDYLARSGTLTFAEGQRSLSFTVPIENDAVDEAKETVRLALSNVRGGATLGAPTNAILTITDNDTIPSLSISDETLTEGDDGTRNATFTVRLSVFSARTVTVGYATDGGTATSPADYKAESGTLTFSPGQTQKTVTVSVKGDSSCEPDETFFVRLSRPTNATISDRSGTGIIANDDDSDECTIVGTDARDALLGKAGRDVICALGGDDTVLALGGDDVVRGGPGNDTVDSSAGSDTVYGGEGDDVITGGDGNDSLVGGTGKDVIGGQAGDDVLDAMDGSGGDELYGGSGADTCRRDRGDKVEGCP